MAKITIDGIQYDTGDRKNVLQVILDHNIEIPHYCYHPGLSVAGACRMCTVEVEGMPQLQISCNLAPRDGMVVRTNSPKVQEAVKGTLELHLINHPLDCPICDQAGECGLQEYYMKFGLYESEMVLPKQKKEKAVDIGKIVLDQERCILCSRCVRFCEEVAKSPELVIENRGDQNVLTTFQKEPMKSSYSLNTVDICPVGALTSKDFRFKQRVWFLNSFDTICPGCSTGCNVKIDYSANQLYRMRPRYNPEVNGYWMCDDGRETYKYVNAQERLLHPLRGLRMATWGEAINAMANELQEAIREYDENSVAALISAQVTNEDAFAWYHFFVDGIGTESVYHHLDANLMFQREAVDGILIRADKNPNSRGLYSVAGHFKMADQDLTELFKAIQSGKIKYLAVVVPENLDAYPLWGQTIGRLSAAIPHLALFSADESHLPQKFDVAFPVLTYAEKRGTFTNALERIQTLHPGPRIVPQAKNLQEILSLVAQKMKLSDVHIDTLSAQMMTALPDYKSWHELHPKGF